MELLRDTVVQVDLDAIRENMREIHTLIGKEVSIMAVIKANGYGHGAIGIAPALIKENAAYLAVATLTEALELREAYHDYPIFILGHTPDHLLPYIIEKNITQTIVSFKQASLLNDLAKQAHKKPKVHLKVDTGFHRLGMSNVHELNKICQLDSITIEGIFSHLALVNKQENDLQYNRFLAVIDELEKGGASFRYKHIADSISAVDFPKYHMNMIRPGALIYGLKGFHTGFLPLQQALTFLTRISQIHEIKKGDGVGYDYLWKAEKDTRIATLPFGYADGYPRNLRGKGYVLIHSVRCPIIGVICMDQCMVDLTDVPNAKEGDSAIIYGDGADSAMDIEEAAKLAGTNKNEIVSRIANRPPRIYLSK
ncbi:alanine racemase [Sinanaerobacter sp. ZZT-01]|uniref:alanine racemase n=1 Tax=Sinanaerobacter sp. ZZT-01 TaxID=3111540 RepID=UPI002D76B0F6|nr:alanine racemase [Sinanaerobacter sp. ZZT-01]WRR94851.1 alanine racemase [Sinanaerobacter sp. ZZT-01]